MAAPQSLLGRASPLVVARLLSAGITFTIPLVLARVLSLEAYGEYKQIFLVTDGKPSAITENNRIYKNPFGLDMRIVNLTLEEADACRRQKVVITTFMLATDPMLTQFVEKLTQINRGRAYFASPYNLGEFILADYIKNRRRRVR